MKRSFVVGIVLACLSAAAAGTPLTWTLNGITFSDGGTASGSFTYDASTNTYSAISIVTTGGSSPALNTTYSFVCTAPCTGLTPSANNVLTLTASPAGNLTGLPAFALLFSQALANGGGARSIAGSLNALCSNATCAAPVAPTRTVTGGVVVATVPPVPTLSTWGLVAMALLLAGVAAWRRRKPHAR